MKDKFLKNTILFLVIVVYFSWNESINGALIRLFNRKYFRIKILNSISFFYYFASNEIQLIFSKLSLIYTRLGSYIQTKLKNAC